jgi:hypothetical protein
MAASGVFRAPTEAMDVFLDSLDAEFGSLDAYLEGIGVDAEAARAYLADALLAEQ